MKLSHYAKKMGLDYRTVWNWYKEGKIPNAYQTHSGTIIIPDEEIEHKQEYGVILYARTSSSQNKELLDNQVERLKNYATSRGYKIKQS